MIKIFFTIVHILYISYITFKLQCGIYESCNPTSYTFTIPRHFPSDKIQSNSLNDKDQDCNNHKSTFPQSNSLTGHLNHFFNISSVVYKRVKIKRHIDMVKTMTAVPRHILTLGLRGLLQD